MESSSRFSYLVFLFSKEEGVSAVSSYISNANPRSCSFIMKNLFFFNAILDGLALLLLVENTQGPVPPKKKPPLLR